PDHPLNQSDDTPKHKALSLRGLAQKDDPLALEIFDTQAKALGIHVANVVMSLDPAYVVIGGGLIDPDSTTAAFRTRYLDGIRNAARPFLWPAQRERLQIVPATLGELSQAIGAALVALYSSKIPDCATPMRWLILTSSTGTGHHMRAESLRQSAAPLYGDAAELRIPHVLAAAHPIADSGVG